MVILPSGLKGELLDQLQLLVIKYLEGLQWLKQIKCNQLDAALSAT